ncbi:Vesicle-associated protein 4-2 [Hibiscus syriacus]|uniref:Vesicle-associated protein 4-2 n=1 Tax=Hibiscus syriacus TaxID=106335 RepID=A0A6A3BWM5_HIBSY|nr:Vesicle-associated protein 4-2 [Hibiscus syriacus]
MLSVFKFVEPPENNEKPMDEKNKVKFKILSLKVKGPMDYISELFHDLKDQVVIEQILQVVFLDPLRPGSRKTEPPVSRSLLTLCFAFMKALEKLNHQLAEADVALEAGRKPREDAGPRIIGEGLVIDEWKERRERYLARQQVEKVDSV